LEILQAVLRGLLREERRKDLTAKVLDGRALAKEMKQELAQRVDEFKGKFGFVPTLAVVRGGEDPASVSYTKIIKRTCESTGITFAPHILPEKAAEAEMVRLMADLSQNADVHGIIVQEPLPEGVRTEAILDVLVPEKDIDGVHPVNAGRLMQGEGDYFVPATPAGGMEILRRNDIALKGKRAVVVGRSNIVGKPIAFLLLHQHATVTMCHSRTVPLGDVTREADILVAAVGKPRIITVDMVKPGAVVIDFGVNFVDDKMVGDVDYEAVAEIASAITPVPGGTGPATNVMLARNTLEAATWQMTS
jgi:methylenetetrahydrofolate dehydrogenase (NADP+)/methenyltetrahydrofolate cyclohydrolase